MLSIVVIVLRLALVLLAVVVLAYACIQIYIYIRIHIYQIIIISILSVYLKFPCGWMVINISYPMILPPKLQEFLGKKHFAFLDIGAADHPCHM